MSDISQVRWEIQMQDLLKSGGHEVFTPDCIAGHAGMGLGDLELQVSSGMYKWHVSDYFK